MPKSESAADVASASKARFTHPDRLYWPEMGLSKQGLADYWAQVWPWAAPYTS